MIRDQYEQDYLVGTRKSRKTSVLLLAVAFVALAAVAVWMSPGGDAGLEQSTGHARQELGMAGSIGTSGQQGGSAENSGPGLVTIHELETITGSNDGHELVGRRVNLHVPVQQHVNDVAFWVGPNDNRLLVVLSRDNRDGGARQRGEPASTGLGQMPPGQQASISGVIERVPYAEAMYSWGLTNNDRRELMDRRIYIRADSVMP